MMYSTVYCPEGFLDEAYRDANGNCVAVQLSKVLRTPLEDIENEIETIWSKRSRSDHWREAGVSADIVGEMGLKRGMPVYVMSQGRKVHAYKAARAVAKGVYCLRDLGKPRLVLRH